MEKDDSIGQLSRYRAKASKQGIYNEQHYNSQTPKPHLMGIDRNSSKQSADDEFKMHPRPKNKNAYNTQSNNKKRHKSVIEESNTSNLGPVMAYAGMAKNQKDNIKIKRKAKKKMNKERSLSQLKQQAAFMERPKAADAMQLSAEELP